MLHKYKTHFLFIAIFIVLLIFWTFPVIFQIDKTVYGPIYGTDNRAVIWNFWWYHYAQTNHLDASRNMMVNFPFGSGWTAPKIYPWYVFPAYWLSGLVNELFAYNILIFSSFVFCFLTMYLLVFYLTKQPSAAFISGLIYAFAPYHVNKSWEHFGLMFIDFIPLATLGFLILKKKQNFCNILFCAIGLALVIMSDLTYAFIVAIFALLFFIFALIRQLNDRESPRLIFKFFGGFSLAGILAFLACLPFISSLVKFSSNNISQTLDSKSTITVRPFQYLFSQSAGILAYFIPSKYHPWWGGFAKNLEGNFFFGRGPIEQTLYVGWVGIFLAYLAIRRSKSSQVNSINYAVNRDYSFAKSFFVFLFCASFIISMQPYWDLLVFKIYFPSFFLYKILPFYRAYARFGVLALLGISVLSGLGFARLTAKMRHKAIATLLFSVFILVDFMNFPPSRVAELNKCPPVYQWLKEQKGTFPIVEYPVRIGSASEGYNNLDYLFYQRCHEKASIEGDLLGNQSILVKKKIVNILNPGVPEILKSLGIKYAIVHLRDYRERSSDEAMDVLGELPDLTRVKGFRFIKKFGDDEVYEIVAQGHDGSE